MKEIFSRQMQCFQLIRNDACRIVSSVQTHFHVATENGVNYKSCDLKNR